MGTKKHTLAIATGLSGTALALGATLWVQATAMQNQPTTPTPTQTQPQQPQPAQPLRPQPAPQPVDRHNPPIDQNAPSKAPINPNQPVPSPSVDPSNPNLTQAQRDAIARTQAMRPFAFQSPQAEARFNEANRKLMRMEQKFEKTNQEQLRRLGEIRLMAADRQGPATLDLLQQLLQERAELQRYLAQSRMSWMGEMDSADPNNPSAAPATNPSNTIPNTNPATPNTAPPANPATNNTPSTNPSAPR